MDDATLHLRLKRLSDERFSDVVAGCVGADVSDLPPTTAERSARTLALMRYVGPRPAARAALVERLGGEDPVARWLDWGVLRYGAVPVLGFRGQVVLTLDDVFVQLQVAAGAAEPHRRTPEHMEAHTSRNVSPSEALVLAAKSRHAGIVLLGDPGSGKTTLLQHLYIRVASGNASDVGMPDHTVPVLVRIAAIEAGQRRSGGLRDVIDAEAKRNGHAEAAEMLRGEQRPYLLLLDGLDEVRDEAARVATCRWLDDEIAHFPNSRFVVSCRYAAWQREARLNQHFLPVDVLLLDDAKVREYVGRWFRAVGLGLRGVTAVPDDEALRAADERATRLLSVLLSPERNAQLRLRDLTGNPLLLSTLCLVSYEDTDLPQRRSELYDRCVKLLLESWTERRHGRPALPDRQTRLVLQPLAWAMHERDLVDAPSAELEPIVARAIDEVQGFALSARELLERARDDCGVFTGRDVDSYRFFHLTFQEYLAACHAQHARLEAELAAHANDPRWQEVILLAVARGGLFEPFVRQLVKQGKLATSLGLLRECLLDADVLRTAPFIEVLNELAAARSAAVSWQPPPWWKRVLGNVPARPQAPASLVASAAAVFTLLKGRDIAPLHAHAQGLVDDEDEALRNAAMAFVGRAQRAPAGPSEAVAPMVEPVTGMTMLWVPPGRFMMGSSTRPGTAGYDFEAHDFELPAHPVTLTRGIFIAQHPVTNAVYQRFVQATGARAPDTWQNRRFNDPAQPVVDVSFENAVAFCAWLTQTPELSQRGLRCDLPTEAEWEYAARGVDGRRYPWGDDPPTPRRACFGLQVASGGTARVGERPAGRTPFGCEDMAGNVWEWCLDGWRSGYGSPAAVVDPCHPADSGAPRAVRGGSWGDRAGVTRCAARSRDHPRRRYPNLGFRVVFRASRPAAVD